MNQSRNQFANHRALPEVSSLLESSRVSSKCSSIFSGVPAITEYLKTTTAALILRRLCWESLSLLCEVSKSVAYLRPQQVENPKNRPDDGVIIVFSFLLFLTSYI